MNLSPSTRLSAFTNRAGAPQVLHGTRSGRGGLAPTGNQAQAFNATAARHPSTFAPPTDAAGPGHSVGKEACLLAVGEGFMVHAVHLPPLSASPAAKAAAFDSIVRHLKNSGASPSAMSAALASHLHDLVSSQAAWTAVNEAIEEFHSRLFDVTCITTTAFVDGFGGRHPGTLDNNPSKRPDNIKFVEFNVVIPTSKSRFSKSLQSVDDLHFSFCLPLQQQAYGVLDEAGTLVMPQEPLSEIDPSFFASSSYSTPKMSRAGKPLAQTPSESSNPFPFGTYVGSTGFADHQECHLETFGPNPIPLTVTISAVSNKGNPKSPATISSTKKQQTLRVYEANLSWSVLSNTLRTHYVGIQSIASTKQQMLHWSPPFAA
jgi:hypothetical protein